MYKGSLAKYYDDIYHDKDYSAEAEISDYKITFVCKGEV